MSFQLIVGANPNDFQIWPNRFVANNLSISNIDILPCCNGTWCLSVSDVEVTREPLEQRQFKLSFFKDTFYRVFNQKALIEAPPEILAKTYAFKVVFQLLVMVILVDAQPVKISCIHYKNPISFFHYSSRLVMNWKYQSLKCKQLGPHFIGDNLYFFIISYFYVYYIRIRSRETRFPMAPYIKFCTPITL